MTRLGVLGAGAAVVALALLLSMIGCRGEAEPERPVRHVIFLSLDTTRADHFGFYGNTVVKTPQLDRLAQESIVFDDYMTVVPTTLASHTSLFTGKYAHSHGTPRNGFTVNTQNVMLAELLADHGFATAGFVAAFPLDHRFGIAQGFEHYDDAFDRLAQTVPMQDERSAAAVTDAVVDYLDGRDDPRNLFLFVHYFDPHMPYAAPAPFDTLYDSRGVEGIPIWPDLIKRCRQGELPDVFRQVMAQYASEISYMDEQIGRLLDSLRERGILDDALLVVTSDHGEMFREHPDTTCFDHGWSIYQPDVNTVGLVRLPEGRQGGTRVPGVVANIDILPSVLRYLGIPAPEGIDGEAFDLSKPRRDREVGPRFAQATKPASKRYESDPQWANMRKARCVRQGRYKLVQGFLQRSEALYDLEQDPDEKVDLLIDASAETLERAERLRTALEAWAASADPLPSAYVTTQREEVLERLRKLGYVVEP